MQQNSSVNDLVVRFANVNGTGSASANALFAKAVMRMGIPVSPKNIFPSNIQGLPTWYEVRINENGYLGRRDGIDLLVCVNPQSMAKDVASVRPGGYFVYDSTKKLHDEFKRSDIHYIGIPMMQLAIENYRDPRQRQLFKNIIYVGALSVLLDMDYAVLENLVQEQFKNKAKLIPPNLQALELGRTYAREHFDCPLPFRLETRDAVGDRILIDGNAACALGAIYAGATVAAWYPITPSTSVALSFEKYANKLRIDPESGQKKFAVIQAEDELAAIGMVIGATWNGARAFTATSGPGVSLMNEFIGLSYYAEIPVVLIDVQRGGPSTGMPTRTQQADLLAAAYASHGDTKHPFLLPANPNECFELTADAFDLAERLQTLVMVLTDLDLGMNDHLCAPLKWDEKRRYDRGKVYTAQDLEALPKFGRYLDVDGDGIPYRTIPGTHPTKGSYFTRGTSRDEYARYTEDGDAYVRNVNRLQRKWETTKTLMPKAEIYQENNESKDGMLFFGTTTYAALEAMDQLEQERILIDCIRLRAFPFGSEVEEFIQSHDRIFVVEQNRDAQMRTLLINELETAPQKLVPILNYDGTPISADLIRQKIMDEIGGNMPDHPSFLAASK